MSAISFFQPSHSTRRAGIALALLLVFGSPLLATAHEVPGSPGFIEHITDPQNAAPSFLNLLESEREWLIHSQREGDFTAATAEDTQQNALMADWDWVDGSGYNYTPEALAEQGTQVLMGFAWLPQNVLDANLDILAGINNAAYPGAQRYATVDAFGYSFMYFLADALGPRMGNAFMAAYTDGQLSKAAALLKRTEVDTEPTKDFFAFPRPYNLENSPIVLVNDNYVFQDGQPYVSGGFAFPSGHTNMGQTDALLMASMLPERFTALLARASGYGYNRLVMGVHYPLDVIGGRMYAEFVVSHYLNDPAYRALFSQARDELRAALTAYCGVSIAECAAPGDGESDPWATQAARNFHDFTMNYGLPAPGEAGQPMVVPEGAEVLLEAALPNLSAEQRRSLLEQTADPSGEALDQNNGNGSWQRLNLIRAYELGTQQQ